MCSPARNGHQEIRTEQTTTQDQEIYRELKQIWNEQEGDEAFAVTPSCWQVIRQCLQPGMKTLETGSGLSTWL